MGIPQHSRMGRHQAGNHYANRSQPSRRRKHAEKDRQNGVPVQRMHVDGLILSTAITVILALGLGIAVSVIAVQQHYVATRMMTDAGFILWAILTLVSAVAVTLAIVTMVHAAKGPRRKRTMAIFLLVASILLFLLAMFYVAVLFILR